jgi:putative transposase
MFPDRKLTRARGFDYREPGPYFVTICLASRGSWLGEMSNDGLLTLNEAGEVIAGVWRSLKHQFVGTILDDYIVMPDHVHGILTLPVSENGKSGATLGQIIGWFKTVTTKRYGVGVRTQNWTPFDNRLWQASFHDHIIRDELDLDGRRKYIERNPWRWVESHPEVGENQPP